MTDKQDQRVDSGGQAVQAGRDIIIHKGMSPTEMSEIMIAMAKQLSAFSDDAEKRIEARLQDFRADILKEFARSDGKSDPDAFRDPDFQYLLIDAQKAYARSGDGALRGTLVDIIKRRSLEKEHNRIAITLDEAATKAPAMTGNEFAALSLVYIVRYTINNGINTFNAFCKYVVDQLMPFVPDITTEQASYWHIEAQSCGLIEMGEVQIYNVIKSQYAGVLGKGFDRQTLEQHLPDGQKNSLDGFIIPCVRDVSKFQPNAIRREIFLESTAGSNIEPQIINNVWNAFENTVPPQEALIAELAQHVPNAQRLFELWEKTPLKNLKLNTVGLAIAHANAVRVIGFDAPLAVWIK
jgi:hypothetical protein